LAGSIAATIVALLASATPLEAKIVDRIVAMVNLDVITQGDLDRLLNEQIQALRVYQGRTYDDARQIAEADAAARLEDLIASTLLDQEARRQEREKPELQISQIALDEEIKNFRNEQGLKDDAAFEKALSAQNYTQATFRREMLKSLRIKELLKRDVVPRIHVTDAETITFYNEHRDEYPDKDAARDVLRERRFGEERERYIRALRERAMVKTLVRF
jgi:parvulin-like peptidyl-prolyl isomerase